MYDEDEGPRDEKPEESEEEETEMTDVSAIKEKCKVVFDIVE